MVDGLRANYWKPSAQINKNATSDFPIFNFFKKPNNLKMFPKVLNIVHGIRGPNKSLTHPLRGLIVHYIKFMSNFGK